MTSFVQRTPVRQGKYLHPDFIPELCRLYEEILEQKPTLIVTLGNTALWALTGQTAISKYRGTVTLSREIGSRQYKVLPTFHPSAVLRDWSLRPIVLADLLKAERQSHFPEIRRPERRIWISPGLDEIKLWTWLYVGTASTLSVDVETRFGQITEIGFATDSGNALVIPFIEDFNRHFWKTEWEECAALELVAGLLATTIPKVFQNGLYDIQYIWKTWGITPRNCLLDTMLHSHSLWPEMQKGLGFLGSIFTDEPAWKILRTRNRDSEKADDE